MSETIIENFARCPGRKGQHASEKVEVWLMPPQLNPKVAKYYDDAKKPIDGGPWLDYPEIPTAAEILDIKNDSSSAGGGNVEIATNRPKGAWESKEDYLSAHYELLREDAIRPLREAVQLVRVTPQAKEDAFDTSIGIYEKVHICSVVCSTRGIALRVTFSLFRAGKKILWEQSKRLVSGSLVVLTTAKDQFRTKAIVATVAARPLEGLRQNPPEIDLFVARAEELEIDPAEELWMVEHRGSMYEADKHTLAALQRMMREPFPLQDHIVGVKPQVPAPTYLTERPYIDMTSVLINNKHETYENVHILQSWPTQPHSDLDASQMAALRRILTKRLAIIQGPPGTGKTFISVQAIKIMLANRKDGDAPIIVACQTNHAADQLLNHIAEFETEFVRLGGRSKDKGVVKSRTLHEVRKLKAEAPLAGSLGPQAKKRMRDMDKEFKVLLSPLDAKKVPMDHKFLTNANLITQAQADSLERGASQWVQTTLNNPNEAKSPFTVWLGKHLVPVPSKQQPEDFGFDYEEADLEYEQLKDIEAENANKDDEAIDDLKGQCLSVADNFTCRDVSAIAEAKVEQALKQKDFWKIPEAVRPAVYRHLQLEMKRLIISGFREKAKQYDQLAIQRRIGVMQDNERILKDQKLIGMTTTGLSKYRGLLAALDPKVVLVEEAAEVLEAPVAVACMPTVQQLVLVGDHKQLRPHCKVKDHEDKPFYLNVSLFERMVKNGVEYDTLTKQRRMIPEIRRVLYPIYGHIIKDHASVLDPAKRPPVPGMGGVNSLFFTHEWHEQRDDQGSAYNPLEADMIVGFVKYLVYNGVSADKITLLTFYNGQRKKLLSELRKDVDLAGQYFNVVTVDSYQGEENDFVLLSLVRSNSAHQIGFLNIDNRVCVALSRARRGFYMFGNGRALFNNKTWCKVLKIMANQGPKEDRLRVEPVSRVVETLTVRCSNHNEATEIQDAGDWDKIKGGCEKKCTGSLPCGHPCTLTCHPFSHDMVNCFERCAKVLTCCGCACEAQCGEICMCKRCQPFPMPEEDGLKHAEVFDGQEKLAPQSTSASWQHFANAEPKRYAEEVASVNASRRNSPEKGMERTTAEEDLLMEETTAKLSFKSPREQWESDGQAINRTAGREPSRVGSLLD